MKLEAKTTRGLVTDMGVSWYKAFEKEFSKEYFQKVDHTFIMKKNIEFLVGKFHCR